MDNPLLPAAMAAFPDVDAGSLPWPADAGTWDAKGLELFIGSGGFLKPKKKPGEAAKAAAKPVAAPSAGTQAGPYPATAPAAPAAPVAPAQKAAEGLSPPEFEKPVFRSDKQAFVMPVRVHCEDTAPHGVVQIHSLVAFAERIRSLCLKQQMHVSLDDLRKQKLAILATEYVVEIVGKDVGVMHTLRLESSVEFPGAPLFPWDMKIYAEDNSLYATGMFGLNLCSISDSGAYAGVTEDQYRSWTSGLKKYVTAQPKFSANSLRFFHAFPKLGTPFRPCKRHEGTYIVRSTDCDMYNVLFQARVPAMMESCHPDRRDAISFYVNIRMSVRPGDELVIHVLSTADAALFICMKDKTAVLTAFGHYGTRRPIGQEEIKCGSFRLPILQKYFNTGDKPAPNEDVDLSDI